MVDRTAAAVAKARVYAQMGLAPEEFIVSRRREALGQVYGGEDCISHEMLKWRRANPPVEIRPTPVTLPPIHDDHFYLLVKYTKLWRSKELCTICKKDGLPIQERVVKQRNGEERSMVFSVEKSKYTVRLCGHAFHAPCLFAWLLEDKDDHVVHKQVDCEDCMNLWKTARAYRWAPDELTKRMDRVAGKIVFGHSTPL